MAQQQPRARVIGSYGNAVPPQPVRSVLSIPTVCPVCKEKQIQRVSMAYSAGTTTNAGSFFGVGGDGEFFGGGTGGVSQTNLASALAPPVYKSGSVDSIVIVLSIVGFIVGVGMILTHLGASVIVNQGQRPDNGDMRFAGMMVAFVAAVMGTIAVLSMFKKNRYNTQEYPVLRRRWDTEWICHRCGARFTP